MTPKNKNIVKAIKKQNIVLIIATDEAVFNLLNFQEIANKISKNNEITIYIA